MDHKQIDQLNIIDRYLMGKLLAEESASFEGHFVDCPQCIAQLQTTEKFIQDLRFVAAEQASQTPHRQPRRTFAENIQTLLRKPLAWAACCLLLSTAAGLFFVIDYTRRLRTDLSQAESLSKQWEHRYEEERQSAMLAERKHQETELQRAEQLSALEAKLKDEETQRAKMAAGFNQRISLEGKQSIFPLTSVRGSEPDGTEPIDKITISRSSTIFAFSVPLDGEEQFENYRITIFNDHRRPIWKSRNSMPDKYNSFSLFFKPELFRPGHYSLTVEGFKKEGGWTVLGNYPFQITKTL